MRPANDSGLLLPPWVNENVFPPEMRNFPFPVRSPPKLVALTLKPLMRSSVAAGAMSMRVVAGFTPASLETPATALEPKSTARRAPLERRKPQLRRL